MASAKVNTNPAKGVKWDLTIFYKSLKDPQIEKDKSKIKKQVKRFIENYRGKIKAKTVTSKTIYTSLSEYEELLNNSYKLGMYANLLFSGDTSDQNIKVFNDKISEFQNQLSSELVWLDLELKEISDDKFAKLISSKELKKYKYFLETQRKFKPFTLSEKEEVILVKKSQTSSSAFVRFFDEKTNYLRFPLKVKGKTQELTLSELTTTLSQHEDRKVRIEASKSFTDVFKANEHFYTFTLNTLLLDKKISDEIRGFKYLQEATFLDYDVAPKTVDSMVNSVSNAVDIVSQYYKAKQKIQKIDKMHEWDRYSPLFAKTSQKISWQDCRSKITDAFSNVSPEMVKIIEDFYNKKWIDAELRPFKSSGAFCSLGTTKVNPFVLCNYTGELSDLTTVAHELGHGIHGYLSSRNNSTLNMWPSTATAEIASIFAESLTFDYLLKEVTDKKVKLNLLANKIEGMMATIYRQTEFYLFETDLHNHRKEKSEISTEEISNYYQTRLQHMFGDSLELTEGHKYWWMYISHFYHYNFYVFTYAFGELLSLSLYEKYKIEGQSFIKDYTEALKAGGSMSPSDITKMMGVNINDENFWKNGLQLLRNYVDEFEELSKSV